eukprot:Partr_v1_DN27703_c2_g1_i1_m67681 putative CWC25 spliceosome-associated protein homolog (S. cerevisiae)
MGGGDLNLKKDWHTQTRANLERVWLAEEKVEKERKRIDVMLKERKEERERSQLRKLQEDAGLKAAMPEKLDWMYAGVESQQSKDEEREAFLLGRKRIESSSSATGALSAAGDSNVVGQEASSAANGNTGITPENQLRDLQNKIREDPLFAIKVREREAVDRVASNPLKMRRIRTGVSVASSSVSASSSARYPATSHRSSINTLSAAERQAKLDRMQQNARSIRDDRRDRIRKSDIN